jgi:hypothetical protein
MGGFPRHTAPPTMLVTRAHPYRRRGPRPLHHRSVRAWCLRTGRARQRCRRTLRLVRGSRLWRALTLLGLLSGARTLYDQESRADFGESTCT